MCRLKEAILSNVQVTLRRPVNVVALTVTGKIGERTDLKRKEVRTPFDI